MIAGQNDPSSELGERAARSLADVVDEWAQQRPGALAYVDETGSLTWADYAARSDELARTFTAHGLARGTRVAVLLPDGMSVHLAYLGLEKAGLVAVGIGPRAGVAEIEHLLRVTGAAALVSHAHHRDLDLRALVTELRGRELALELHFVLERELSEADAMRVEAEGGREPAVALSAAPRRMGPEELFFLNSTSGTTGLPKCVCHHQQRWFFFHELALRTGRLTAEDVFMSVVPAPFGFGIWTSHVTPTLLGAATVLTSSFDADEIVRLLEAHRVTVLAAVSTQFILLLDSPAMRRADLGALRVLYTGGEAVPAERAARFEERTGASVLQFYGSNESGALSGTRLDDSREQRLGTAGRPIPEMQVRLFDEAGNDVTESGRGEPACRGPAMSRGYYDDPEANEKLFWPDGWMRVNDIVELDDQGYLRVVGRTGDFIIRGGKNISGPAVEAAVMSHPAVSLAAAVAMPDPVFGERVCAFVELRPGHALTFEELVASMLEGGCSKELLPERLEVVEALPRSSGGKVAKHALRGRLDGR